MAILENEFAERVVLANILATPDLMNDLTAIITPADFHEAKHELIYGTIQTLHENGRPVDAITIASTLAQNGQLAQAGDLIYFKDLMSDTSLTAADPVSVAFLVKEASRSRELVAFGAGLQETAVADGNSADDALQFAERSIVEIINRSSDEDSYFSVKDLYPTVMQNIIDAGEMPEGGIVGVPTGFPELDDMTGGFKPGQFIIIAARPAVGKSTLAVDFARSACFLAGKTVVFFSLEMGEQELAMRILSAEARVKVQSLKKGQLTNDEWVSVRDARDKFEASNFYIDSNPKATISRVRSIASRQMLKPEGLDMIVIDYLQLMEVSGGKGRSRENEVSELSRSLKLLAKELGVPVIVLSQLNRKSEERQEGKPLVSDLRESGSLEQDADMVFLIHRPEVIDPDNRRGEADLIIGKHRGGPTGTIPLVSMLAYSKFAPGDGTIPRDEDEDNNGEPIPDDEDVPW